MTERLEQIKQAVIGGKHKEIESLVQAAVDEKVDLNSVINAALIAAMDEVGQQFATEQIFVPEMLISALTMQSRGGQSYWGTDLGRTESPCQGGTELMATYNFRRIQIDIITAHDPSDFSDRPSFLKAVLLDLLHHCPHGSARDSALVCSRTVSENDLLEQFVIEDKAAKDAAIA